MADKVFTEPKRIRDFASDLSNFREHINELADRLRGNLSRLSESWRDEEFEKFREVFETAQQRLRKFSAEVEETLPKLERDAAAAEEIHRVKPPIF
jgi:uncharacterized protein YukE